MSENTITKIMDLKSMPLEKLQKKYKELFDGKKHLPTIRCTSGVRLPGGFRS